MLTLIDCTGDVPIATPEIPTRTQVGEVWRIGKDRLLVGDSQNEVGRYKLLQGGKVDCVFTDPPYNFDNSIGKNSIFTIKRNNALGPLSELGLVDFDPYAFLGGLNSLFRVGHHNSMIFTSKTLLPDYLWWAKEQKLSYNVLVWHKNSSMPLGGTHYSDIEYLVYLRRSSVFNNADVYPDANRSKVLQYSKVVSPHPTPKPVELIENQIRLITTEGDLVYDPYAGSGSTWVACIHSKRQFVGAEILPRFADLALSRAEEASGERAIRDG